MNWRFSACILEANPSLLAKLCRYIAASGQTVYQPGLIVLTYENPTNFHYRQIRKVFTSPTASSYGTTETGYVFMQCEAGKFHQNTQFCRVDFQPLKKEHGGPSLGRILVTPFHNEWYHLLRFDVGDLVRLDETGKCACGRHLGMILSATEGRFVNATLTCAGRLVTSRELDNNLSALEEIDEYKLEQTAPGTYELHLASRAPDKRGLSESAASILKELYGREAKIAVIHEDMIAPESFRQIPPLQNPLPVKDRGLFGELILILVIIKYLEREANACICRGGFRRSQPEVLGCYKPMYELARFSPASTFCAC